MSLDLGKEEHDDSLRYDMLSKIAIFVLRRPEQNKGGSANVVVCDWLTPSSISEGLRLANR